MGEPEAWWLTSNSYHAARFVCWLFLLFLRLLLSLLFQVILQPRYWLATRRERKRLACGLAPSLVRT